MQLFLSHFLQELVYGVACCSQFTMTGNNENIPNDVIESLPPCPPSLDRAQLPHSGLEEERFESSLYITSYHSQWMNIFRPGPFVCYVQAIVQRVSTIQVIILAL